MRDITYLQAVYEAQHEEMERDERVFIIGEDIEASFFGTTPDSWSGSAPSVSAILRCPRTDSSAPPPARPWSEPARLWT